MAQSLGPMDVLRWLDKSNCRKCGKSTCLAFAAAVVTGRKRLDECPRIDREIVQQFGDEVVREASLEQDPKTILAMLREQMKTIDPAASADRLGAKFADGELAFLCLGKPIRIDTEGNITSDLHRHSWVTLPIVHYLTECKGIATSGTWVLLCDLPGGKERYPLFVQRCEKPCKSLADDDPRLFSDILSLFGRPTANECSSRLSYLLYPLPRVPILVRYWKPEGELESTLNLLCDKKATENLSIEMISTLVTGMVMMLEKIARGHGWRPTAQKE